MSICVTSHVLVLRHYLAEVVALGENPGHGVFPSTAGQLLGADHAVVVDVEHRRSHDEQGADVGLGHGLHGLERGDVLVAPEPGAAVLEGLGEEEVADGVLFQAEREVLGVCPEVGELVGDSRLAVDDGGDAEG